MTGPPDDDGGGPAPGPAAATRSIELAIPATLAGLRIDRALAEAAGAVPGLSRTRIAQLIAGGAVAGPDGGTVAERGRKVKPGETYRLSLAPPQPAAPEPEAIPLAILHEDADLIVIDKPAGMVVHPAPGAAHGTLVNALLAHCADSLSGIGGALRPGIVHRIDKDTSGIVVVAKTQAAHEGLAAQFAAHTVERRYLALARGAPDRSDPRLAGLAGVSFEPPATVRIETQIARHPTDRLRMAVRSAGGRRAVTRLAVLERFGAGPRPAAALLECRLETGRTHQIRVHAAHLGHALLGDPLYGRARTPPAGLAPEAAAAVAGLGRQALHAARLGFLHPKTGARLGFESPLPPDLAFVLGVLRRNAGDIR